MRSINSPEYARNLGFWNETEQQALMDSSVAIAGVGGDGFHLGTQLARMGVGELVVADPEIFEAQNINRVPGAKMSTLGHKKVDVFAETVRDINPDIKIRTYDTGVQEDNVEEFVRGTDLVFDESELTYLHIGTMLAREARKNDVPELLVMNVGFAAQATSFHPNKGKTFEDIMGIPKGAPLDEVRDMQVDFSGCLPTLPAYGDLRTLESVQEGSPLPSISAGVDVAAALGTTQALLHLTKEAGNKRRQPVWAPKFAYMDAYTLEAGVIRAPRLAYIARGLGMTLRSKMGVNALGSYTQVDRDRRDLAYQMQTAKH